MQFAYGKQQQWLQLSDFNTLEKWFMLVLQILFICSYNTFSYKSQQRVSLQMTTMNLTLPTTFSRICQQHVHKSQQTFVKPYMYTVPMRADDQNHKSLP